MTTTLDAAVDAEPSVGWQSLHLWVSGERDETDRLLVDVVAPLADALVSDRAADRWFFIRYSEGGQHVRLRLHGASAAAVQAMADTLRTVHRLRVTVETYLAEQERYGGAELIGIAEDVFCASTRTALAVLRPVPASSRRLAAAVDLILATAAALDLDTVTTVAWLRNNACSWRWHRGELNAPESAAVHNAALHAATTRQEAIGERWQAVRRTGPGTGIAASWSAVVRRAHERSSGVVPRARLLGVWSSQLHMLLNRLGVVPDEERWLEWMVASALESPGGIPDFFSADVAAPDRAYLAASRYVLPLMAQQAPRDTAPPDPLFDWSPFAGRSVALPGGPVADVTLQEALTARRSGRGPYSPLSPAQLGSLLWNATTPDGGQGLGAHAYPSAGGKYPVRLRVAVLDVAGLESGLYEADPARHRLVRLGERPTADDLAATSMWLVAGEAEQSRIDARAVPVVIGLYLDLGAIRARYGLRALRFSLLEAGHVAQNLALLAAATGTQTCTIGGLYDDVAHDVFLLDGTDRVLAYLLPVGGAVPAQ